MELSSGIRWVRFWFSSQNGIHWYFLDFCKQMKLHLSYWNCMNKVHIWFLSSEIAFIHHTWICISLILKLNEQSSFLILSEIAFILLKLNEQSSFLLTREIAFINHIRNCIFLLKFNEQSSFSMNILKNKVHFQWIFW